ncbi:MAG: hypothetical protein V7605_1685 [Acidimicrobiaceae bacterium]
MDEATESDGTTEPTAGLGGAVLDAVTLGELLQGAVLLARRTLPSAHSVSITVAEGGAYRTSNSTGDEALHIDETQYRSDEGPCLEALRSMKQVQVAVEPDSDLWPRFQASAHEKGVTAVLSTPLFRAPGDAIGALNIYSHRPAGFADAEVGTANVVAEQAAILVANASALAGATQLNDELRNAVASREIIGEAKGIIMERQSCTRDEAFEILRRASQRENRKLRGLAEELVRRVETRAQGKRSQP